MSSVRTPSVRFRGLSRGIWGWWPGRWVRLRSSWGVALLVVVLFGAPLLLGGALAVAVPLWTCCALAALACTGIDVDKLRRDRVVQAGFVLVAVSVVQLIPLPPVVLRWLDGPLADLSAGALLPFGIDRSGSWRALHIDPGNGYSDLQYIVGLLAAYAAARQAAYRGHGSTLRTAAALSTLWIAIVALAHKYLGLERVYGFYSPVQASPAILSPLLNSNHLAAFVGAGVVLWAGRTVEATQPALRVFNGLGVVLCGAVVALSLSRGGIAATVGGLCLFVVLLVLIRNGSRRRSTRPAFVAALVAGVGVAVGIYVGWEAIAAEYSHGDLSKFGLIARAMTVVWQHPVLGVGSGGAFAAVTVSRALPAEWTFERAECLPVDLAISFGPVVALVVLVLGVWWLWELRPVSRRVVPERVAGFSALVTVIVHDLVDFALWLGATGMLAAIVGGSLAGDGELDREPLGAKQRPALRAPVLPVLVVSIVAGWFTARSPLYVDRQLVQSAVDGAVPEVVLRQAVVRHPADPYLPLVLAGRALRTGDRRALRLVNRAMLLAPDWSEPHTVLAQVFAAFGYRSQALVELRHSVGASDRGHARMAELAVRLAPTREELERMVPEGDLGLRFLRLLGERASREPTGVLADALLLSRAPNDVDALSREAVRAHHRGEISRERALYERLVRAHPQSAQGYVGLAGLCLSQGDLACAEEVVRRGLARGAEPLRLLPKLAEIQARRRDTVAMRRTMQELLDLAGADIDRRIDYLGMLGTLEEGLGHDAAALGAYERADAMAFPRHPYLGRIVVLAHRLRDVPRLRHACGTLRDEGMLEAAQREICAEAERVSVLPSQ